MTHCPLQCEGEHILQKEQTRQKRVELRALRLCCDRHAPLFQEELDLEEIPLQTYSPNWELGD